MNESTQSTLPRSDTQVCNSSYEKITDPKKNKNHFEYLDDEDCPYCQLKGVLVMIVEHRSEKDEKDPSMLEIRKVDNIGAKSGMLGLHFISLSLYLDNVKKNSRVKLSKLKLNTSTLERRNQKDQFIKLKDQMQNFMKAGICNIPYRFYFRNFHSLARI